MGKFGKRRLPRFMELDNNKVNEAPDDNTSHLDENHPIEIVSLGDHGDDHAMIKIKTHEGEELELRFDYNGDGMLTAQHGDHEYSIPVEVEVVEEPVNEFENQHMSRLLDGQMLNLIKKRIAFQSEEDSEISGIISEVDESEGAPMLIVKNEEGQTIASIMYDEKADEFIDGMSSWKYVYMPSDSKSARLLQNFIDNYYMSDEEESNHLPTFESFVNECWSPMEESYNPAMSEEAKKAIKALCEELLIKEAQTCDEDADPNHTYENYLNECGSYLSECMAEAATNLKVD